MFKFLFVALSLFGLIATADGRSLGAGPTEVFQGKIAAISERSVMLVSRQGENLAFVVAPDCMVTLDGKQVALTALGVGNTARISASVDGNVRLASRIDARTLEHPISGKSSSTYLRNNF